MRQWLCALLIAALPLAAWSGETLITIPSPRGSGISQAYIWSAETAAPKTIYLLFPGYPSVLNLRKNENGDIKFALGSNFLIRTRALFAGEQDAAASMDAPSDQLAGFDDGFRSTLKPAQDIAAVIDDLKQRYPRARIIVVGNSASVTGVAHLAKNLPNKIDAVVLSATVMESNFRIGMWGLGNFDFHALKQPLLFVHHLNDTCSYSPYTPIERLGYSLITVIGQDPPLSDACQARSAHGFWGRDAQVVAAIHAWAESRPYSKTIE
jgi:pimeloyl-ACP methyl ester carboxylesterase